MLYTTLTSLKAHLGITDTAQDTVLTSLIETATELIDTDLGENLEIRTKTRRIDGSGTNRIIMENTINSVIYVKDVYTLSTYTVDFISGYEIYLLEEVYR